MNWKENFYAQARTQKHKLTDEQLDMTFISMKLSIMSATAEWFGIIHGGMAMQYMTTRQPVAMAMTTTITLQEGEAPDSEEEMEAQGQEIIERRKETIGLDYITLVALYTASGGVYGIMCEEDGTIYFMPFTAPDMSIPPDQLIKSTELLDTAIIRNTRSKPREEMRKEMQERVAANGEMFEIMINEEE